MNLEILYKFLKTGEKKKLYLIYFTVVLCVSWPVDKRLYRARVEALLGQNKFR